MRKRDLDPGFFDNPDLAACGAEAQLLFAGLWCDADRDGRLKDEPQRIRAHVFPYNPERDVSALLDILAGAGFVIRYRIDGVDLLWIPKFLEHQHIHPRERASSIPPYPAEGEPKADLGEPKADLGTAITGGMSGPSACQDLRHVRPSALEGSTPLGDIAQVGSAFERYNGKTVPLGLSALCVDHPTDRLVEAIKRSSSSGKSSVSYIRAVAQGLVTDGWKPEPVIVSEPGQYDWATP